METYKIKNKVLAYIIRDSITGPEILAFTHRDFPEAGLQVPGGTLDEGEDPLKGILREVKEESGLETFAKVVLLEKQEYVATEKKEIHLRSFFQLNYEKSIESTFTHIVSAGEEDGGLVFIYRWSKLEELPVLAGDQGAMLSEVKFG